MQNNITKRKIFWFLKRNSSLTLWKRINDFHQPFLYAIEKMIKNHPKNNPDHMQLELYKYALDNQINFHKGLALLERGDRSVFRDNEDGFLLHTSSARRYIINLLSRGDCPDTWRYTSNG